MCLPFFPWYSAGVGQLLSKQFLSCQVIPFLALLLEQAFWGLPPHTYWHFQDTKYSNIQSRLYKTKRKCRNSPLCCFFWVLKSLPYLLLSHHLSESFYVCFMYDIKSFYLHLLERIEKSRSL